MLLVEDDPEILATTREGLSAVGWDVVSAPDGLAAMGLLDQLGDIGVLVSDVVMSGGVGGVELARNAVQAHPGLPVLLISGHPGAAVEAQGGEPMAFDLLAKPFDHEQLIEAIRRVAARRPGGETAKPHRHGA